MIKKLKYSTNEISNESINDYINDVDFVITNNSPKKINIKKQYY